VRTPKFAGTRRGVPDPAQRRRSWLPQRSTELVLGVLMVTCFLVAMVRPHTLIGAPFLLLFASGWLGVGVPGFRQAWEAPT
jgi:hypothetical protein